jgi:hypothetical protein
VYEAPLLTYLYPVIGAWQPENCAVKSLETLKRKKYISVHGDELPAYPPGSSLGLGGYYCIDITW